MHRGGVGQTLRLAAAVAAVGVYAFAVTYGIGKLIDRVTAEYE